MKKTFFLFAACEIILRKLENVLLERFVLQKRSIGKVVVMAKLVLGVSEIDQKACRNCFQASFEKDDHAFKCRAAVVRRRFSDFQDINEF